VECSDLVRCGNLGNENSLRQWSYKSAIGVGVMGLGKHAYGRGWNGTVFMCSLMHFHTLRMDGVYIIQFVHAYGASAEECKQWESLWFVRISLSPSSIYAYKYVFIDT
jgi:hypothetical protein